MKQEYIIVVRPWRVAAIAAAAVVVVLLCGTAAFAWRAEVIDWIDARLLSVDPLQKSDAIVVLSGGTPEREVAAADLLLAGWAPKLVMTLEPERLGTTALLARGLQVPLARDLRVGYMRAMKVPENALVVLDPPIASTVEEAERVREWAVAQRVRSLLIVTSPNHTRRARYAFVRHFRGTDVTIRMAAANGAWQQRRITMRESVIELQKLLFYRVRYCC